MALKTSCQTAAYQAHLNGLKPSDLLHPGPAQWISSLTLHHFMVLTNGLTTEKISIPFTLTTMPTAHTSECPRETIPPTNKDSELSPTLFEIQHMTHLVPRPFPKQLTLGRLYYPKLIPTTGEVTTKSYSMVHITDDGLRTPQCGLLSPSKNYFPRDEAALTMGCLITTLRSQNFS